MIYLVQHLALNMGLIGVVSSTQPEHWCGTGITETPVTIFTVYLRR